MQSTGQSYRDILHSECQKLSAEIRECEDAEDPDLALAKLLNEENEDLPSLLTALLFQVQVRFADATKVK